jgi:hypothetical protein
MQDGWDFCQDCCAKCYGIRRHSRRLIDLVHSRLRHMINLSCSMHLLVQYHKGPLTWVGINSPPERQEVQSRKSLPTCSNPSFVEGYPDVDQDEPAEQVIPNLFPPRTELRSGYHGQSPLRLSCMLCILVGRKADFLPSRHWPDFETTIRLQFDHKSAGLVQLANRRITSKVIYILRTG